MLPAALLQQTASALGAPGDEGVSAQAAAMLKAMGRGLDSRQEASPDSTRAGQAADARGSPAAAESVQVPPGRLSCVPRMDRESGTACHVSSLWGVYADINNTQRMRAFAGCSAPFQPPALQSACPEPHRLVHVSLNSEPPAGLTTISVIVTCRRQGASSMVQGPPHRLAAPVPAWQCRTAPPWPLRSTHASGKTCWRLSESS